MTEKSRELGSSRSNKRLSSKRYTNVSYNQDTKCFEGHQIKAKVTKSIFLNAFSTNLDVNAGYANVVKMRFKRLTVKATITVKIGGSIHDSSVYSLLKVLTPLSLFYNLISIQRSNINFVTIARAPFLLIIAKVV